jgi:hypothetical protein
MFSIVTTRFNNETKESNYFYRKKHNLPCLYCSPSEITYQISYNSPIFVIEMNNSTNKIEGIGLIKNNYESKKYCKVHNDGNNNRYIYKGNYFLDRNLIENYNSNLVFIIEEILFKGKTHSKRGSGLLRIPEKVLKLEICQGKDIKKEIKDLFIYEFRDKVLI